MNTFFKAKAAIVYMMIAMTIAVTNAALISVPVYAAASNEKAVYGKMSAEDKALIVQIFDKDYYSQKYPELQDVVGTDYGVLLDHFTSSGIFECRSCNQDFDVNAYASGNKDLRMAFGRDIVKYYRHYITIGRRENREITTMEDCALAGISVASLLDEKAFSALDAGNIGTLANGTPATIVVHRVSNTAEVINKEGQLIRSLIVSTGREGHRTPLGSYKIYEHTDGGGYHYMIDGTCARFCMRFNNKIMFHSVCYARAGDLYPLQDEVDALGTAASLGCVRLSVLDAEWLYNATPNGCAVSIVDD